MNYKIKLGIAGEDFAVAVLENIGYKIIDRNYRTPSGEIDIIAKKNNEIHFVEVKTRMGHKYGYPAEAIDDSKKRRMKLSALIYLKERGIKDKELYIDAFEVEANYLVDCV